MKNRILIIEDNIAIATTQAEYLSSDGYQITFAYTGQEALDALEKEKPHGVLLDLNLPDMHGLDILKSICDKNPECAIIVVTGEASMKTAIEAMQSGAHDFVPKPASPERLRVSMRNALERVKLKEIAQTYEKISRAEFQDFVGKSPKMQAVYTILESAANSKASVFITGESGTGKELAARAAHRLSGRANKPLEILNCAAIPANLLESEIFGHVKGAFTGAISNRKGAASRADGGTLFLDELTEMPMELQAKLLRFIQTGTFMAVGDMQLQSVDVRFICASNRDPMGAIKDGFLREDLYYRLNVIPIQLPPLHDRGDDILRLAYHFLEQSAQEEKKGFKKFSQPVEDLFQNYRWPGNVRELENTIRRIVVLNNGDTVDLSMVDVLGLEAEKAPKVHVTTPDPAMNDAFLPQRRDDIKPLWFYEREAIRAALDACNGNITEASKRLDINPATIHRKQKQWQVR